MKQAHDRTPPLIAIIAALQGVSALVAFGVALRVLAGWQGLEVPVGSGPVRPTPFAGWGRLAAIPALGAAFFCAAFARGLWRRRAWAHTLMTLLLFMNVLADAGILIVYALPNAEWMVAVAAIVKSTAAFALLWYLRRPHVRASFR